MFESILKQEEEKIKQREALIHARDELNRFTAVLDCLFNELEDVNLRNDALEVLVLKMEAKKLYTKFSKRI